MPAIPKAKELTPAQKLKRLKQGAECDRIVQWCADWHLPCPRFEYAFHPERKWRFDVAFVDHKVEEPDRSNDD